MGSGGVSKKGEVDFFRGGGGAAEGKKKFKNSKYEWWGEIASMLKLPENFPCIM